MKAFEVLRGFWVNKYYFLFAILLFFTPLIFTSNTNELFEFPKMFFVYRLGLIIIFLFFFGHFWREEKSKLKSIPLIVLFLLLINIGSTIFSSHLYTSVWGYYTRFNGGLVSLLTYAGIFYVGINKLKAKTVEKLMEVILLTIVPISLYGITQHFNFDQLFWTSSPVERAFSTFGQPNWLAQYLVMLLPLCLFYALFQKDKTFKIFWSVVYLMGFSTLWFSYSMSGILGFIVGMVFFVTLFLKMMVSQKKVLGHFLVIMFMSLLIAVFNLGFFGDRIFDAWQDLKNIVSQRFVVYAQETLVPGDYKVSDPGFIRTGLWRGTWDLITSSSKVFFIGTGPETYPYEFQTHRTPKLNYSSEWNFVFNKPHNYYLEVWSEIGLFGLLAYLGLVVWLFIKLPVQIKPGLVGFLITNIFGWPLVGASLIFWFWVIYAYVKNYK